MRTGLILALAAAGLAGCTTYGDRRDDDGRYGGYRYDGSAWDERRGGDLEGPGAAILDPWLAETEEGSTIVRAHWTGGRDGWIDEEEAERANAWFRRYADTDGDLCLTDPEIRAALVRASGGGRGYARRYSG